MKLTLVAAALLSLAPSIALARVSISQGRVPPAEQQRGLETQRMWQDRDGQFALARPDNNSWSFHAAVKGPDGQPVPLFATSEETGAQLVVQSAQDIKDLKLLAKRLKQNLANEEAVRTEETESLLARGGEAYGFSFTVAQETRGRVAVVRTGDKIALVIASWPLGAPATVADEVEKMIGSLGPVQAAVRPGVF